MHEKKFKYETVYTLDMSVWIHSKKECYKSYVDRYYGGWIDEQQAQLNTESFKKAMQMSYFRKIMMDDEIVGFCGYDEKDECISGVTIHLYEKAQNCGVGSEFLRSLTEYSHSVGKPIYLKVFRTNPARKLYERFGFEIYDETQSHYLMVYGKTK